MPEKQPSFADPDIPPFTGSVTRLTDDRGGGPLIAAEMFTADEISGLEPGTDYAWNVTALSTSRAASSKRVARALVEWKVKAVLAPCRLWQSQTASTCRVGATSRRVCGGGQASARGERTGRATGPPARRALARRSTPARRGAPAGRAAAS